MNHGSTLIASQTSQYDTMRAMIRNSVFLDWGVIDTVVDDTHVTVAPWYVEADDVQLIENVELLRLGSATVIVSIKPKKGDIVALVGSKHPVTTLDTAERKSEAPTSGQSYTYGTVKALQVYTPGSTPIVTLSVNEDDGVALSIKGNVKVDVDGTVDVNSTGKMTLNGHLEVAPK